MIKYIKLNITSKGEIELIRYKVKNHNQSEKEVIIEIEEEFTNTLIHGLNISVEDDNSKDFILNISLTYTQTLELYKMLTEKMCSTQIQMLDIIRHKKS